MNLIVAFVTGLTAGGLGCLALQSGLLASSLANQLERDLPGRKFHVVQPLLYFLSAKLFVYSLLGYLLGLLGSVVAPTAMLRAGFMIVVGVFMLGNGLRMLKVHPKFRYFVFETPSFLNRYIRRKSRNVVSWSTPITLGLLTVFLPCGVAQSMMAASMVAATPWQGALILFAFTLGTLPVFILASLFAVSVGSILKKQLTRFAAVLLMVLGLISVDYGLNLAGSPVSISKTYQALMRKPEVPAPTVSTDRYEIQVVDHGYTPEVLHLKADQPVTLHWVTEGTTSCALTVVVPGLNYEKTLPSNGDVLLAIPAQKNGTILEYSCSMGMYHGRLVFDR